ncbi:hypothetical protein HPB49_008431 [Dermacentor silvarum]|uniref:Uncharacterized protein n=1 Tax=Dermacentor silvarum TaxID=543639 RepID=A0ACB8C8H2_DERSI|nr:hypothetical protein HPB49_008431 [Dermacentor silvarum]
MSNTDSESEQASNNQEAAEPASTAAVGSNVIHLPDFWERNQTAWFIQAESRFELSRITTQTRKYLLLVDALPATVIDEIADLLCEVRERSAPPYDANKAAVMDHTGTP